MFASLFRYSDQILFYHEGGADVGDVDAKAETMDIDSGEQVAEEKVVLDLLGNLADQRPSLNAKKTQSNLIEHFRNLKNVLRENPQTSANLRELQRLVRPLANLGEPWSASDNLAEENRIGRNCRKPQNDVRKPWRTFGWLKFK